MSLTSYALTGRVYDASGSPVEGATVRLLLVDTRGRPTADYVTGGGGFTSAGLTLYGTVTEA